MCLDFLVAQEQNKYTLERYKKVASAKIVIFQSDFFRGFVREVLTTSFVPFDTCLAMFIIETGG